MIQWRMLKVICVLLITISSTGCALAVAKEFLGDKVATHDDDQSVETGGNRGNFN